MSKRLFGTDGVRGVANEKITAELAFKIGQSAGRWVVDHGLERRVLLGRDTRRSGSMLGAALASGFCAVGVDVETLGVVPTGAVSFLTIRHGFSMGAVISASHNPAPDNGVKLIGADGRKATEEAEREIEATLDSTPNRPTGAGVGSIGSAEKYKSDYLNWLISLVPERLDGLKIAMDCAHGAAHETAPALFSSLGAGLVLTGTDPDGMNINADGGATKPETIQRMSEQSGCDIGIAFDGDADRAVFCDDQGRLINGDRTMAIWSTHWSKQNQFSPSIVVGTVMSNGGFERHMQGVGVELLRTDVGDKYVSAKMREVGAMIGGEQSGHIIFSECLPTGDGLVTALQICRVLKREGRRASAFFGDYESWPQLLVNVAVKDKDGWSERGPVREALLTAESSLGHNGRLNVRASGTQPMLRVMVEADGYELRDKVAESVVSALIGELGGEVYSRVDLTHALGD